MKINLSLKIRLAFLVLAIAVVLLITVTASFNRDVLLEAVGAQTISLAEEILDRIDSTIFLRIEQIELYFKHISTTAHNLAVITEELITFFNNKYANALVEEIIFFSREGDNLFRFGEFNDHEVPNVREVLSQAIEKSLYLGEVYYSEHHGKPIIPVCIQIINLQQEFYVYVEMSALEIFRDIEEWYTRKFDIQTKLTNRDGRLLYSTGIYHFYEDLSSSPLIKDAVQQGQGYQIIWEDNKEKLFSYTRSKGYRNFKGTNWILFIGYEIDNILEKEQFNNLFFHSLGVLLLLTTLITGIILSRQITIPVRKLVEGTMRLQEGKFDEPIDVKSNDELGDLAEKFNAMSHQLDTYYSKLVHEIDKRKIIENELKDSISNLNSTNRELEQFAYVASHDLQEPLRSVAGFLQLLERQYTNDIDEKGKEYINRSVNASKRLQTIINGLLYYSRTKPDYSNLVNCNLNTIIDTLVLENQTELDYLEGKIVFNNLPTIRMNEDHLKQVFSSLIKNAIKYFRKNIPPEIIIQAEQQEKMWKILVKDNGIGIEGVYFEKIFELFQRLHSRKKYEGNGLGLAICKKIINLYGGEIWVESELGKGAVFYFTLPQAPLEDIHG